jgi:hypothetical protein
MDIESKLDEDRVEIIRKEPDVVNQIAYFILHDNFL